MQEITEKRPRRESSEAVGLRQRVARRVAGLRVNRCVVCGRWFRAKRKDTLFCSDCSHERRKKQDRERRKALRGEPKGKYRCPICGAFKDKDAKTCLACHGKANKGERNPNWKGGRTQQGQGYVYIRCKREGKNHPYQLEHIVVWEKANGKPLPEGWIIHHLNGIKDDNRIENLSAMPRKRHSPWLQCEPYKQRIRQLEEQLR
ncbi:MAG TPA: HNH endonuclease signature motif containing protein [Dehalococcoidia bacterium]|nr:HNH endonuclease signature motif containing protein [Dehalococcoidia bacterium]